MLGTEFRAKVCELGPQTKRKVNQALKHLPRTDKEDVRGDFPIARRLEGMPANHLVYPCLAPEEGYVIGIVYEYVAHFKAFKRVFLIADIIPLPGVVPPSGRG